MKAQWFYDTPIGKICIAETDGKISHLIFMHASLSDDYIEEETALIKKAATQVFEYFDGKRKEFDLPLNPMGTDFQRSAWAALETIPYGETRSYKDIAVQIGNPKGVRAVGMANNRNPISIIIPCHRVIGSNGSLTGYGGGLDSKQFLLDMEIKNG